MLHHNRTYIAALDAERRRADARRRPAAEPADLTQLIRAATAGEAHAWAAIRRSYDSLVRGVARRHRLTAHDVEDVAQATWLRLFEHIGSIRDPEALGAWLATTARRESLRVIDATKREYTIEHEQLPEGPAPAATEPVLLYERRAALAAAFDRLPARHGTLMWMLIAEPAPSYAEISRALDIPVGSIGPIRARSLARLRRDRQLVAALA